MAPAQGWHAQIEKCNHCCLPLQLSSLFACLFIPSFGCIVAGSSRHRFAIWVHDCQQKVPLSWQKHLRRITLLRIYVLQITSLVTRVLIHSRTCCRTTPPLSLLTYRGTISESKREGRGCSKPSVIRRVWMLLLLVQIIRGTYYHRREELQQHKWGGEETTPML